MNINKLLLFAILLLTTINGQSQELMLKYSALDRVYSIPADTAYRQVLFDAEAMNLPWQPFIFLDTISIWFENSEDTTTYTFVGIRSGTYNWNDTGIDVPFQVIPYSELDLFSDVSVEFPFGSLSGFSYTDIPGDSISGFDLLMEFDEYPSPESWVCFWYITDHQSNWLNFRPLEVGNIWKYYWSYWDSYYNRYEIYDSVDSGDTTYYYIENQHLSNYENDTTEVSHSIIYTTSSEPYQIQGYSGPSVGLSMNLPPFSDEYPAYFNTLLPRGDGSLDYGLYYPWSIGVDLMKYGVGDYFATGDFGWTYSLIGYQIGYDTWGDIGTMVSIDEPSHKPSEFSLKAFPNPFNPVTKMQYELPEQTDMSLTIYNIAGRTVTTLVNQRMQPGQFETLWNGTDDTGKQVAGGMYFARLEAGNYSNVVKLVYLR